MHLAVHVGCRVTRRDGARHMRELILTQTTFHQSPRPKLLEKVSIGLPGGKDIGRMRGSLQMILHGNEGRVPHMKGNVGRLGGVACAKERQEKDVPKHNRMVMIVESDTELAGIVYGQRVDTEEHVSQITGS
jgi:hypothetical protein